MSNRENGRDFARARDVEDPGLRFDYISLGRALAEARGRAEVYAAGTIAENKIVQVDNTPKILVDKPLK